EMLVYSLVGAGLPAGILKVAPVRLVNGPSRCAGRVEVFLNQQWGTVCDDGWNITDAGVVCRQLGCGTALSAPGGARFGPGSDPIWLADVNCAGTEPVLSQCRARLLGVNNCNHGEDAGVCLFPWVFADAGISEVAQLRLVNGPSRCAGRLEVFHNQQWGTVCDNSWDLQDAGVVCRQLGCGTALSAPRGAHFGQGSDHIWLNNVNCTGTEVALSDCRARPWGENNCTHREDAGVEWARFGQGSERIWLDDVNCTGTEATLSDCRARPWGDNNCDHGEDAGVVCSEVVQLRLVNGPSRCAGRVEVLHNELWGTVCDDSWDITDAGVVCWELGCGTALSAPGGARFGRGSDRIWLDDVHCTGTEAVFTECRAHPWGDNNCNHGEDAGVPKGLPWRR
uniref:Soluble scavenger receptor cysteine-rich domain-containing protein SSC5D n=1 Tax=Chrysemys picta bellii TaxID=8478 RepID=A0A8C3H9D4_CHRPI